MKYRVSELEGALLDLAVAKADGICVLADGTCIRRRVEYPDRVDFVPWSPSGARDDGGPIIDRERIALKPETAADHGSDGWRATMPAPNPFTRTGPTSLIAAMRAYVASKFGGTVEL